MHFVSKIYDSRGNLIVFDPPREVSRVEGAFTFFKGYSVGVLTNRIAKDEDCPKCN